MKSDSYLPILRSVEGAACVVIILFGVWAASSVLGPLILGLILAYAVVPFPTWLMHRFKLSKSLATALTAVALVAAGVLALFTLETGIVRLTARLPLYEEHLAILYSQIEVLMSRFRFIDPASLSFEKLLTPERLGGMALSIFPQASAIASEAMLIFLLASLFLIEMLPAAGVEPSLIAEALQKRGAYARGYVVVTAKSAAINALINLAALLALGVETPFLWCFLYFFMAFIPFLGPAIAMVPPILVALLMLGWKKALLVAGLLILAQLIVGNVVMPILAKKVMSISFLEITLSLVVWTFLLGLPGAIAATPLTLVLKELISEHVGHGEPEKKASV